MREQLGCGVEVGGRSHGWRCGEKGKVREEKRKGVQGPRKNRKGSEREVEGPDCKKGIEEKGGCKT